MKEGPGSVYLNNGSGCGSGRSKHMDPRDPVPQDWFQETDSRDGVFFIWSRTFDKYFFPVWPPMVNNIFFEALHHTERLQFLNS